MKGRWIVFGCVVAVLFLIFSYSFGGSDVPNGQQPLVRLNSSNVATLKETFNASGDTVRLLVLLSPT